MDRENWFKGIHINSLERYVYKMALDHTAYASDKNDSDCTSKCAVTTLVIQMAEHHTLTSHSPRNRFGTYKSLMLIVLCRVVALGLAVLGHT